jgi:monoamine oxidase
VKYSAGGWAIWTEETRRTATYRVLTKPDRALYFAGDHVSYTTSWMQGAFQAGRAAALAIHERVIGDAR